MSLVDAETPEGVRTAVLQSLRQHEILPTASAELPPRITYTPTSFDFLHQCHDCGNRMMRVEGDLVFMYGGRDLVGPDNEIIPPGYFPIDDDWEAPAARYTAMLYDPRWLIARLDNLQVANQQGGQLLLRGELSPEKLGMTIQEDRPLESLLGHFGEEREGFEWARQEFLEAFQDPNTAWQKAPQLIKELEGLKEEDIPDWVRRLLQRPYLLEIELDETRLPKVVRSLQNATFAPFPPDGITFEYNPKNL